MSVHSSAISARLLAATGAVTVRRSEPVSTVPLRHGLAAVYVRGPRRAREPLRLPHAARPTPTPAASAA